jgi:hypothetical protein
MPVAQGGAHENLVLPPPGANHGDGQGFRNPAD